MTEPEPVIEVRVANCHLCDSEKAVRGVTTPPHLGGVHLCGPCLLHMVRVLVSTPHAGREARW